jgi:alkanesulfonate monooxygenase SsuD/methylene tetrahydromethanopterin reductase-like flavin-dependent oxidoreductase (luciferase family)
VIVADLGLVGSAGGAGDRNWADHMRDLLEPLPPAFTTAWISDHLQQDGEAWPEGWTRATYLAAAVPRYRVGHLVLSQSYRNPALLAAMGAQLQLLSGGRFILGLGAGWLEEEYRAYNFDYPSGGTRVAQLAEAIEIIRGMWTGQPTTYDGEWYRVSGAVCDKPSPRIPIMVGTNGPKALRVVARLADWWQWDGPWEPSYRPPFERLKAACEEIGRPFEQITLTAGLEVSLPEDTSTFEPTMTHPFYPGQLFGISGPTAAEVIRDIEKLVDLHVRHFQLHFSNRRELDRFVAEVIPHVRLEAR